MIFEAMAGEFRSLLGRLFSVQAINLNQAKEGAETAVAFFISMVSGLLEKPVLEQTVVLGEMSVQGMLLTRNPSRLPAFLFGFPRGNGARPNVCRSSPAT